MGLVRSLRDIEGSFWPRFLFVAATTFLTSPLRLWERLRYGRAVGRMEIEPSPVFIIGHWRSGTTHLQNLLCQDERFGFLTTFQAMAPGMLFVGHNLLKRGVAALARRRYPTRLIDRIPLDMDAPQEDEFALANLTPLAFVHVFTFPRRSREIFERSVLFSNLSEKERARWRRTYLHLLRKLTLASGGRRLLVKNCGHSARLETLLDLFPKAKFIHIHRNPYEVFLSTRHMHRTVLPRSQLQSVAPAKVEGRVLEIYERLMRRFLTDRERIPEGSLVEVRFEDLEVEPLTELQRIYERLGLPGFADVEPAFRRYAASVSGYRRNVYALDANVVATVNERWAFAFDALGYDRIAPSQGAG